MAVAVELSLFFRYGGRIIHCSQWSHALRAYLAWVPSLRVATFNVHHCRGLDGRVDVARIAGVIRSLEADLVALQELDRSLPRSGGADQPAELARLLEHEVVFRPTLLRGEGAYGLAVAARPPLEGASFVALPQKPDEEPRGAIVGRWRGLELVCTHLSTHAESRRVQTAALGTLAAGSGGPALVLGDLNQSARTLGPLTSRGYRGAFGHRTLPRPRLRRQIDHILVRGAALERSWTRPTDASDHLPLVAELALPPP